MDGSVDCSMDCSMAVGRWMDGGFGGGSASDRVRWPVSKGGRPEGNRMTRHHRGARFQVLD
jgi:hypothetical protein